MDASKLNITTLSEGYNLIFLLLIYDIWLAGSQLVVFIYDY